MHIAAGGKMVPFAGYSMPVQYSDDIIDPPDTPTICLKVQVQWHIQNKQNKLLPWLKQKQN